MTTRKLPGMGQVLPVLATMLLLCGTALADYNGSYQPDRLVCELRAGYIINYIETEYGTTVSSFLPQTGAYLLLTHPGVDAESLAAAISFDPAVLYCSANYYLDAPEPFQRSSPFLDNQFVGTFENQPAATALALGTAHTISSGIGVRVGIIDTGINSSHPQFALQATQIHSGWDFVDNDADANDEPGGIASGHGTFVAGAVSLVAPAAELYGYRTLDTTGRGDGYTLAAAIVQAIGDNCRVINLSLGMNGSHVAVRDALDYAESLGVVVVAAAGNDSTGVETLFPFPAREPSVIAVAALDSLNLKADFSNWSKQVDLCAPGTRIYAPYLDTSFAWWDGTSFSAPLVAGVAALLLESDPNLSARAIDSILAATATDVDSLNEPYATNLGKGLVNPEAALASLTGFVCGDANANKTVSVSDAMYLVRFVFVGGPSPIPFAAGDCNCSGSITISDIVYLINYIFSNGSPPCSGCP